MKIKTKELGQLDRPGLFVCETIDGLLGMSSIWWTKVIIFNWFKLRTHSTPSTGSNPNIPCLSHWSNLVGLQHMINNGKHVTN